MSYFTGSWDLATTLRLKVDVSISVPSLDWTPIFEWYVVRCGSKNIYQKDTCLKEIRLLAQNIITILGSIANIIGGDLYDHLTNTRILTLVIDKILI